MSAAKKEFVKIIVVMSLIAMVAGGLIGVVYEITRVDVEAETLKTIAEQFPELQNISVVNTGTNTITNGVNDTYAADGKIYASYVSDNGTYVIKAGGYGAYGGEVILLVAIKDNIIQKIAVFAASETPGIGSRALPPEMGFINQFTGADVSQFEQFSKGTAAGGTAGRWLNPAQAQSDSSQVQPSTDGSVTTVTGATKSSTGVINAVNMAVRMYKSLTSEG